MLLRRSEMNYWYVWPIGIVVWSILGWGAFAYFEANALKHNARKDQITLSFFLYTIGSKFPLSILMAGLMIGMLIGGLGVHVLWHYCPPGSVSGG
jgi:hypothetical protein